MSLARRIPGFPGYLVDDEGNVWSKPRKNGLRTKKALDSRHSRGYLRVQLYDAFGDSAQLMVHRLVAEAFLQRRQRGMVVHHKNGDLKDNRAENLEWIKKPLNLKSERHPPPRPVHYTEIAVCGLSTYRTRPFKYSDKRAEVTCLSCLKVLGNPQLRRDHKHVWGNISMDGNHAVCGVCARHEVWCGDARAEFSVWDCPLCKRTRAALEERRKQTMQQRDRESRRGHAEEYE